MDSSKNSSFELRDSQRVGEAPDDDIDGDLSEEEEALPEDDDWYDVIKPIGKKDTEGFKKRTSVEALSEGASDGVVDLAALDGVGREVLTVASYESIVDVDIEEGGVLDVEDEDNNDLFCGVGLDALIENEQVVENLRQGLNIETATHVQLAGIPRVLEGKDIVIQSHTGTGKTLAFLLPLIDNIEQDRAQVQAIIVAPTRELAMQIFRESERLCEGTGIRNIALIGGANPARQVDKLRRNQPQIVVGTPGRVAELHENRELRMHGVGILVVDEVDQCMQDAFRDDVKYLLKASPPRVQKVLVSATSDVDSVRAFAGEHLHEPVLLRVGGAQRLPKNISHWFCVVPARMRIDLLRKLLYATPTPTRAIVFVDEPRRVDIVVERLYQMKIGAGALRGNAHKLERAEVLTAFRKGKVNILVTTEVAARGLDIPEISHVFNLDLPTDGDHYLHRAGRCGRAGNVGTVVSVATADTAFVMGRLSKELGVEIRRMEPREGVYSEVVVRKPRGERGNVGRGSGADAKVPKRRSERGRGADATVQQGNGAQVDLQHEKRSVRNVEESQDDGKFSYAELADNLGTLDMESAAQSPETLEAMVGKVGSAPGVREGLPQVKEKSKKKKKKVKADAKAGEKEDDTVKVKKRWRDTKNKGKRRVTSGAAGEAGSATDREDRVSPPASEFGRDATGERKVKGRAQASVGANGTGRRVRAGKVKSLREKARLQGWVGNR